MSIFKPDIMLMVPMMIETIYKRLAAADPSIPVSYTHLDVYKRQTQFRYVWRRQWDSISSFI